MRVLFYGLWIAQLLFFFGSASLLPDLVGGPGKQLPRDDYLLLMGAVSLFVPLLAGPLPLAVVRRSGKGVNLPHAAYWFSLERRYASVQRLSPHLYAMACWLLIFFAAQHGLELLGSSDAEPRLLLAGLLVLLIGGHLIALLRSFPAPPRDGASDGATARGPARPPRPDRSRNGQP